MDDDAVNITLPRRRQRYRTYKRGHCPEELIVSTPPQTSRRLSERDVLPLHVRREVDDAGGPVV